MLRFLRSLRILEIRTEVISQPWDTHCTGTVPSVPDFLSLMMNTKWNNLSKLKYLINSRIYVGTSKEPMPCTVRERI